MAKIVPLNLELHPKQMAALTSRATEIMYGGAAAGGKSFFIRAAAIIWAMMLSGLQIYIFRRHHRDLRLNHMEGAGAFPVLLAPLIACGYVRIVGDEIRFGNGSKIHLCHCQHEQDVYKFQGPEFHVLIIDECTHFTEFMVRYLRSRCRLGTLAVPPQYAGQFPKAIFCTNPGNIGHNWVKSWFVTPADETGRQRAPMEIWQTPVEEGGFLRQFIPARLEDNPSQDANYAATLSGLGSPELVRAMLEGDWDVVAGGALDDVCTQASLIPQFKVPRGWLVDRSFDWGDSKPFSCIWVAEADGTEAPNGFCPPKGSLIVVHEWYGCQLGQSNKGLGMTSREIADGVLRREKEHAQWWHGTPYPGPADNAINTSVPGHPSIADDMAEEGVSWTASDKSPGSRINGLALMRALFKEAQKPVPESPALYIMENCRAIWHELRVLPRDPKKMDDVDSNAEDHRYDALRYRVLAMTRGSVEPLRMW